MSVHTGTRIHARRDAPVFSPPPLPSPPLLSSKFLRISSSPRNWTVAKGRNSILEIATHAFHPLCLTALLPFFFFPSRQRDRERYSLGLVRGGIEGSMVKGWVSFFFFWLLGFFFSSSFFGDNRDPSFDLLLRASRGASNLCPACEYHLLPVIFFFFSLFSRILHEFWKVERGFLWSSLFV